MRNIETRLKNLEGKAGKGDKANALVFILPQTPGETQKQYLARFGNISPPQGVLYLLPDNGRD